MRKPPEKWWIKLCDFGLCKRSEYIMGLTTVQGTPAFMAPEMIGYPFRGDPKTSNPFYSDMWSLGETIHLILTSHFTFKEPSNLRLFQLGTIPFPKDELQRADISEEAIDFIRLLMLPTPWQRLNTEKAWEHPWMEMEAKSAGKVAALGQPRNPPDELNPWTAMIQSPKHSNLTSPSGRWTTQPSPGGAPSLDNPTQRVGTSGSEGAQMRVYALAENLHSPTANFMPPPSSPNQLSFAANIFRTNATTTSQVPAPAPASATRMDTAVDEWGDENIHPLSFDILETPHAYDMISTSINRSVAPDINPAVSRRTNPHPTGPQSSTTSFTSNTNPETAGATQEARVKSILSKTGFDILKCLWHVATRKNSKIQLGAVDLSCAITVCDVTMNDCPVVYVSDNFQNLTGYSRHEILGRNCRFLQAPDGKVEAGARREFVDDGAVFNLKKMIHERQEVQQSLINYRKGGKPFLNLLSVIPIAWDTEDIRYFIGFQIDLVECPDAIAYGQGHGGVQVNYKSSDIGQYIWTPPQPPPGQWGLESGHTLTMDDVSSLLRQFNRYDLASGWFQQSWDSMLVENTDDVICAISRKGLFLYVSPACKRVLEYDAAELVGTYISTICHPYDIDSVIDELKTTTLQNHSNMIYRIRRRYSGYTWFESYGSLFVDRDSQQECIILVGRTRPVYSLSRRNLDANGGISDGELWAKISTSGMFLFVSSNIRSLLDLQPEALIGTSIQDLLRKESRAKFGRLIEKTRHGRTITFKHEVQNRLGQFLQAQATLYPGDVCEGNKPSFLLAQIKLLGVSTRSVTSTSPAARVGSFPATSMSDPKDDIFEELGTTRSSSWQSELDQIKKANLLLTIELNELLFK